jgi:hypothetical protein
MARPDEKKTLADQAKELLADPRQRITLDAFVNEHLRAALEALSQHELLWRGRASDLDHLGEPNPWRKG